MSGLDWYGVNENGKIKNYKWRLKNEDEKKKRRELSSVEEVLKVVIPTGNDVMYCFDIMAAKSNISEDDIKQLPPCFVSTNSRETYEKTDYKTIYYLYAVGYSKNDIRNNDEIGLKWTEFYQKKSNSAKYKEDLLSQLNLLCLCKGYIFGAEYPVISEIKQGKNGFIYVKSPYLHKLTQVLVESEKPQYTTVSANITAQFNERQFQIFCEIIRSLKRCGKQLYTTGKWHFDAAKINERFDFNSDDCKKLKYQLRSVRDKITNVWQNSDELLGQFGNLIIDSPVFDQRKNRFKMLCRIENLAENGLSYTVSNKYVLNLPNVIEIPPSRKASLEEFLRVSEGLTINYTPEPVKRFLGQFITFLLPQKLKRGVALTCPNPEHKDEHPSAFYYGKEYIPKPFSVRCFSCRNPKTGGVGVSYDIFDLIRFKTNIKELYKLRDIAIKSFIADGDKFLDKLYSNQNKVDIIHSTSQDYHEYLLNRGITDDLILRFGIYGEFDTYNHKKMIVIPVSEDYQIKRYINCPNLRYKNEKGQKVELFNIKEAESPTNGSLFVTEGVFDALSLLKYGFSAVSLNSVNNAQLFANYIPENYPYNIIICMDNDTAGQKAAILLDENLKMKKVNHIVCNNYPDNAKDINELLVTNEELFLNFINSVIKEL